MAVILTDNNGVNWQVSVDSGVTTAKTNIIPGLSGITASVTPASMAPGGFQISAGSELLIDYNDQIGNSYEVVTVLSSTATSFIAPFTLYHGYNFAICAGGIMTTKATTTLGLASVYINDPNGICWAVTVVGGQATVAAGIAQGTQIVTPSSMSPNGFPIMVGSELLIDYGTSRYEVVTVASVTATTFTATFTNWHGGNCTVSLGGELALTAVPPTSNAMLAMGMSDLNGISWVSGADSGISKALGSVSAGSSQVTLSSMSPNNFPIGVGSELLIDYGLPSYEVITVSAVSGNQVTATFANAHSSGFQVAIGGALTLKALTPIPISRAGMAKILYPSVVTSPTSQQQVLFVYPLRNVPAFQMNGIAHVNRATSGVQEIIVERIENYLEGDMEMVRTGQDVLQWKAFAMQALIGVPFDYYPDATRSFYTTYYWDLASQAELKEAYKSPGIYTHPVRWYQYVAWP